MKTGVTIIRKKQGMKSLIKKLVEMQHLSVAVGIHSGFGRRLATAWNGIKKKINIASLAKHLEDGATWIQKKDIKVRGKNGQYAYIKAETTLFMPPRPFISVFKHADLWEGIRNFIRQHAVILIREKVYSPRFFMDLIGSAVEDAQRLAITLHKTMANGPFTQKVKGKNTPLEDTGKNFLPTISHKLINDKSGRSKFVKDVITIRDSMQVDKLIDDINRKNK